MRIVDVLRLVRPLVIVTVQSGEEERDRNTLPRVVEVIRAAVDVVVARPGRRQVELGVEVQRLLLPLIHGCDHIREIG